MGKVKAMLMDAQDSFYELVGYEELDLLLNESESFGDFNLKLADIPGMIQFMRDVGHSTYQYIVTDTWCEKWSRHD